MSQPTWTTKDGTVVPIAGMTDSHLLNTIRYLVRWAKWASRRADNGVLLGEGELDLLVTMRYLLEEATRRGLDQAGPGSGVGGGVLRKDVFTVIEETPVDSPRIPRLGSPE